MKSVLPKFLCIMMIVMSIPLSGQAQVVLDGTMGTAGNIKGPEYDIKSEYGLKAGTNLFHSFSRFDIQKGEIADFSVSADIQNIISRITGGNQSWIDGAIRSTIEDTVQRSQADLFLLNPAGIMFGPNASLDIGGSFHVSTAEYLRMGEKERFYVNHENDVLSSAPPEAFGFLKNDAGRIAIQGAGAITPDENTDLSETKGLKVSDGKTISVIGGDIQITGNYYQDSLGKQTTAGNLYAPGGTINLAGVASPGEVVMKENDLDVSTFTRLGNINLSDHAQVKVSGDQAGDIFIRSGSFYASDYSSVESDTIDKNGGVIDIQADNIGMSRASVYSDTTGAGKGGSIKLHGFDNDYAEGVQLTDFSRVYADTTGTGADAGDGGEVTIKSNNMMISDSAQVSSDTFSAGDGGDVVIDAQENLAVSDGKIYAGSVSNYGRSVGDAGTVNISARNMTMENGGQIVSESKGNGKGGEVSVSVGESVQFYGKDAEGNASRIFTSAFGDGPDAGDAGNVTLKAKTVTFKDGGGIDAGTTGSGRGGNITIIADRLSLENEASVSSASTSTEPGAGDAGSITIYVKDSVELRGNSELTTEAENAGDGRIMIYTGGILRVTDSRITTSVKAGGDDAGDITAQHQFMILDSGKIIANAWEGKGGNIRIIGEQIQNVNSIVDASSQYGIDGTVYYESDDDVSDAITVLPSALLDATRWVQTPCTARIAENQSRFIVSGKDGVRTSHNDWFASSPEPIPASKSGKSVSQLYDLNRYSNTANTQKIVTTE